VRGVKVEKVERKKEARFIVMTPSYEKLLSDGPEPLSFDALLRLIEDVGESFPPKSVHIFKNQDGELSINIDDVDTVVYYVEREGVTAFGTPYADFEIVQLFRVKRHYLAYKKRLYAFDSEGALKAKLQELGIPLIVP
jgi:hypothetical protein